MKITTIKLLAIVVGGSLLAASCKKDDATPAATVYYQQQDQMARPAINTVFINAAAKDSFNTTIPSQQAAKFDYKFTNTLTAFGYVSNALGLGKAAFVGVLSTDVLSASTTGVTTFFDGTNVLTGRALADDVIDTELLLIFGGATGASNPPLTSDNISSNDKAFNTSFPYLASPW
ncbi:MAG: DUF4331 family protein [Chitinophagaceae bacterium]|nr:DUF4331 family protein [Chitinophagaceae bacterium]